MMENTDRKNLSTEQQNTRSLELDGKTVSQILNIINQEDQVIALAVQSALAEIEKAIELTTESIRNGNKVYYIGAGTSGRLGVLDASEMPPTYSVPAHWFNGIIAGGDDALRQSIEGAEDQQENAITDLKKGSSTFFPATYLKLRAQGTNQLLHHYTLTKESA
jgi:N-acetylmuramic acid 6-phosphate etherase